MDNQIIMEAFAQSTVYTLISGILIGSLFSIATLAIFDAIKLMRANCCAAEAKTASKPAAKPVAKKAVAKPAAKKAVAKKPAAKKAAPKKKK